MTEGLERQIAELTAVHEGLCNIAKQEGRTIIAGSLPFKAEAASHGLPTITDSFEIELSVPQEYPEILPRVRETGGKIDPAYEHLYTSDKALCLGVPIEERRIFVAQPSLLGFVNGLVIPYLYSYCHWKQHGKYPFGDQLHGDAGIVRHYVDTLSLKDEIAALAVICFLFEHGYRGHHACPCGSGQVVRHCHRDALLALNQCHTRHTLKSDFEALLRACQETLLSKDKPRPMALLRQVQRILKKLGH